MTETELLEVAWGIIANAHDWGLANRQADEWRQAAERWRDALTAACATVGIEANMTTGDLLRSYLQGYHESGHDEDYAQ